MFRFPSHVGGASSCLSPTAHHKHPGRSFPDPLLAAACKGGVPPRGGQGWLVQGSARSPGHWGRGGWSEVLDDTLVLSSCVTRRGPSSSLQMGREGLGHLPVNTQPTGRRPGDLGWSPSGCIPGAPLSLDQATISCLQCSVPSFPGASRTSLSPEQPGGLSKHRWGPYPPLQMLHSFAGIGIKSHPGCEPLDCRGPASWAF